MIFNQLKLLFYKCVLEIEINILYDSFIKNVNKFVYCKFKMYFNINNTDKICTYWSKHDVRLALFKRSKHFLCIRSKLHTNFPGLIVYKPFYGIFAMMKTKPKFCQIYEKDFTLLININAVLVIIKKWLVTISHKL